MNDTELWRIISEKIQEKEEDITYHMKSGKYNEINRYREDVGFLSGLKFVQDIVKDIYQPKEKEE